MTDTPKTIAIFGATGITGGHLVQESLNQGYHVSVMVRNPAKMTNWMEKQEGIDATKFASSKAMYPATRENLRHRFVKP